MESTQTPIPGWGIDRDPERRPGHPLEQEHHIAFDTVQGQSPATATIPLKGLSGILRRAAHRIPDWKPRRWALLLLADRLDVLESKLTPRNLMLAGGVGGLIAAFAIRRRRR